MMRNLNWIQELDILYDSSTFDTDPFEPQPDGAGTIFPFWVRGANGCGFMELPYTMPQDSTLFIVLRERSIDIWKRKLEWIASRGGMALLDVHPDYMAFGGTMPGWNQYPASLYREFLEWVNRNHDGPHCHALPRDIAEFCRRAGVEGRARLPETDSARRADRASER
jgi:hypothetical protein